MTQNFVYSWQPGTERIYGNHDPNKVAEEILSIGEEPTSKQIVDKARDESTELHGMFEWNNDVAAEKYREVQANKIVNALKIVNVGLNDSNADEQPKTVKLMHHIEGKPGFVTITRIMSDDDMYQKLLEQAKADLRSFKVKYSMLTELKPIFDLIE